MFVILDVSLCDFSNKFRDLCFVIFVRLWFSYDAVYDWALNFPGLFFMPTMLILGSIQLPVDLSALTSITLLKAKSSETEFGEKRNTAAL
jgi:hypothetical protein